MKMGTHLTKRGAFLFLNKNPNLHRGMQSGCKVPEAVDFSQLGALNEKAAEAGPVVIQSLPF